MNQQLQENTNYPSSEQLYYRSSDLGVCAALVSFGYTLIRLDKSNPKKVLFIFNYELGIEQAAADYWSGSMLLSARTMFDNIHMLKNRIYSE